MNKNKLRRFKYKGGLIQKLILYIFIGIFVCAFSSQAFAITYYAINAGCDNNLDGFGGGKVKNQSNVDLTVGCVLQYIYAGPDGIIQAPDSSGNVTGDDVLLLTNSVGNDNVWSGFSSTAGCFYNGVSSTCATAGPQIYVRAWNASSIGAATYYGNSALCTPSTSTLFMPTPNDVGIATFNTNTAKPSGPTPDITSCSPAKYQGDTSTFVNIVGTNTHFIQGTTTATIAGTGVTVGTVEVTSATAAKVYITTILTSATAGGRNITLTTTSEVATGEALFTVTAPSLGSVSPNNGNPGATVTGTIAGTGTHFNGTNTTLTFSGTGVTGEVTGGTATSANVNIYISGSAAAGARNVTMATNLGGPGTETVIGASAFTVNTPDITSCTPARYQGDTSVTVSVVGSNTNFVNGVTTAQISGTGVTVGTVTVTTPTAATVNITSISPSATAGTRNITLITGSQVATGEGLFTISTPLISTVSPNSGTQGSVVYPVTVSGTGTHFNFGTTSVTFSAAGVTGEVTAVGSATSATIRIYITGAAAAGTRDVIMTTTGVAGGTETVTGTAMFTVTTGTPGTLVSCTPNSGYQGDTGLTVDVLGSGTHFSGSSTIEFSGTGVTGTFVSATDATHARFSVTITAGAAIGLRNVTVRTGTYAESGNNLFTVNAPSFTSINPTSGYQGDTIAGIAIVGTGTHFQNGVTTVNAGANITVSNVVVTDPTHLTCQFVIAPSAATGARNISATTGGETVTGTNVFTVNPPSITLVNPNSGVQGTVVYPVTVSGTGTHFNFGTTSVTFSGTLVTGEVTAVGSATSATIRIYIQSGATLGARNVIMTTTAVAGGTETVTGAGMFTITSSGGGPTGTTSFEGKGDVMVAYPNPFNPDDATNPLKMQYRAKTGHVDVYIFDETGRIIWKKKFNYTSDTDAIETWNGETFYGKTVDNGYYMIRVVQGGRLVAKGKIIAIKR